MDGKMCEPKEVIISKDPDLQDLQSRINHLESNVSGGENGEVRIELIEKRVKLNSAVETRQNKQNISHMLDLFWKLERERILYPSIFRQLLKIPRLGASLILITFLTVWLIASIPAESLLAGLSVGGFTIEPAHIRTTLVVIILALVYFAFVAYTDYVEEEMRDRENQVKSS